MAIVALHEGYEGLARGPVFAPLYAALRSPRFSVQEQAYLRSIVDGQWTQQRKFCAAKTLSPLCALCGGEEGSLAHRHMRCSEAPSDEPRNMPGPFFAVAQSAALLLAFKGRPPGYTAPYGTRWQGDRSFFTGVVHGDGSVCEGQTQSFVSQAGVWWQTRQPSGPSRFQEHCRTLTKTLTARNFLPHSCSSESRERQRNTSQTAALLNKA